MLQISISMLKPCGLINKSQTFTIEEFSKKQLEIVKQLEEIGISYTNLIPSSKRVRFCYNQYCEGYTIDDRGFFFDCDFELGEHNKGNANPNLNKKAIIKDECKNCSILPLCMGGCSYFSECPPFKYNWNERLEYIFKKKIVKYEA